MNNYREYLIVDMLDRSTVKLDMKVAPWEVVGEIVSVGDTIFKIHTGDTVRTLEIDDIMHYRLA